MFLRNVSLLAPLGVSLAFLVWNVLSLDDPGSASYFHRYVAAEEDQTPSPNQPEETQ